MDSITKPSITRLARRAGVKSVSEDCFDPVRQLADDKLRSLLRAAIIVNSEHQTKTLMSNDIYNAMNLLGHRIAQSNEISTATCSK